MIVIIRVSFNYVTCFSVLYILMSYIRLHGLPVIITHGQRGWLTVLMIVVSIVSVFSITILSVYLQRKIFSWFFVTDCNKIFPFLTALCCFMWFKDLRIRHSRILNMVGASTFGVLLIHADSVSMRQWLWCDTLQNTQMFQTEYYTFHAIVSCLTIFVVCILIDHFRFRYIETPLFRRIDTRWGGKLTSIDNRIFAK